MKAIFRFNVPLIFKKKGVTIMLILRGVILMAILISLADCSNVCQNLCEEWYKFKEYCGEDISNKEIADCKKDYQYINDEERKLCEEELSASSEWNCDDI